MKGNDVVFEEIRQSLFFLDSTRFHFPISHVLMCLMFPTVQCDFTGNIVLDINFLPKH